MYWALAVDSELPAGSRLLGVVGFLRSFLRWTLRRLGAAETRLQREGVLVGVLGGAADSMSALADGLSCLFLIFEDALFPSAVEGGASNADIWGEGGGVNFGEESDVDASPLFVVLSPHFQARPFPQALRRVQLLGRSTALARRPCEKAL